MTKYKIWALCKFEKLSTTAFQTLSIIINDILMSKKLWIADIMSSLFDDIIISMFTFHVKNWSWYLPNLSKWNVFVKKHYKNHTDSGWLSIGWVLSLSNVFMQGNVLVRILSQFLLKVDFETRKMRVWTKPLKERQSYWYLSKFRSTSILYFVIQK